eukprot:5650378-Pleurochrysis_carterae.AAC.4
MTRVWTIRYLPNSAPVSSLPLSFRSAKTSQPHVSTVASWAQYYSLSDLMNCLGHYSALCVQRSVFRMLYLSDKGRARAEAQEAPERLRRASRSKAR